MAEEHKIPEGIEVKWVAGLYCVSFELNEYEILIETMTPGSAMVQTRDENISVYYHGIDVTHSFIDQTVGTTIKPNGNNLARMMALVLKKDQEDNS